MTFIELVEPLVALPRHRAYVMELLDGYYKVSDRHTGKPILSLRQRLDYPGTFCTIQNNGEVVCGYGPQTPQGEDEFLHIKLSTDGSIVIQRDIISTLPLFYGHDGVTFAISDEYAVVWGKLSKHTLNDSALTEWLLPDLRWRQHTPCNEIYSLDEGELLSLRGGKLSVVPGVSRAWGTSGEAPSTKPHDFMSVLEAHADSVVERFVHDQDKIVFELSGGLDSSFLPLYINQKHPGSVKHASSMLYDDTFRETHTEKLTDLHSITCPEWSFVSFSDPMYRPLRDTVENHLFTPRYYWVSAFEELVDAYAAVLSTKGCKIIFTGDGGDELFDHITNVEESLCVGVCGRRRRQKASLPPFLTEAFREAWCRAVPSLDLVSHPRLAVNLHRAVILRGYFIRHDIWPVTPFANRRLYDFCQGLPVHYRANKNIFRAYYQAKGWPSSIYNPRANEDPGGVLDSIYMSGYYNELIGYFLEHGYVANTTDYVDKRVLRYVLEACLSGNMQGSMRSEFFFFMQFWLQAEIGLTSFA